MAADHVMRVRMTCRKQVCLQKHERAPVRLVFHSLPPLVPHDFPLIVKLGLRQNISQRGQPVGLEPEHVFQIAGRYRLKIIGAVFVRCSVDSALKQVCAGFLDEAKILAVCILRSFEHHVFEQVSEPSPANTLVL